MSHGRFEDGVLRYVHFYKPASTGRISELGGFQNFSKEAKAASIKGIENIYNYDLRSSQLAVFCQEASKVGIDVSVMEMYINDPEAKIKHTKECGFVDDDGEAVPSVWKECFLALVFGSKPTKHYSAPYKTIKSFNKEKVDELFGRFLEVVSPYLNVFNEWHSKLDDYLELYAEETEKGRYFTNAAGIKININKNEIAGDKRRLSAFILQGIESAYIHHLTILSKKFGFTVLSNEHDGLLTIGTIPNETQRIASERSGFYRAILEVKKF